MDSALDFADRHLGVLVTATTTLLFVGKILFAASFQTSTALAIVSATTATTLLLGLAVALTPSAIAAATGWVAADMSMRWAARQPFHEWIASLVVVLFLFALTSSWVIVVLLPLVLVLLVAPRAIALRRSIDDGTAGGRTASRASRLMLTTAVSIYLVVGVLTPNPWPLEQIEVTEAEPVVGYVLNAGDQWWAVLSRDAPIVTYIPEGDVEARRICEVGREEWWAMNIPEILTPREILLCEP